MNHKEQMRDYMALVENALAGIRALAPVIQREVERRHGRKIAAAKSGLERDNLRLYYTRQVAKENIHRSKHAEDRDLYVGLATMHGIAALVEQNEATQVTEAF